MFMMRDYFGCNACSHSFDFLFARKPTDKEKELCKETGWDYLLRKPRNKAERAQSKWYYTTDLENYDLLDKEHIADILEFGNCDECKAFINTVINANKSEVNSGIPPTDKSVGILPPIL